MVRHHWLLVGTIAEGDKAPRAIGRSHPANPIANARPEEVEGPLPELHVDPADQGALRPGHLAASSEQQTTSAVKRTPTVTKMAMRTDCRARAKLLCVARPPLLRAEEGKGGGADVLREGRQADNGRLPEVVEVVHETATTITVTKLFSRSFGL